MADTFHFQEVNKSQKKRICSWCPEDIEIGQPYKSYQFRDGGDTGYFAFHPECYSAMQEMASKEGGWFQWSTSDFHRGCCCEARQCECPLSIS